MLNLGKLKRLQLFRIKTYSATSLTIPLLITEYEAIYINMDSQDGAVKFAVFSFVTAIFIVFRLHSIHAS